MVCIPTGITSVEKRAVLEAAMQAGASKTYLIEEPLAAALGAGLDISVPSGSMVIDIGGGTTDIAILSLGGVVVDSSIRVGGDAFDEAIVRYVKKVYNSLQRADWRTDGGKNKNERGYRAFQRQMHGYGSAGA